MINKKGFYRQSLKAEYVVSTLFRQHVAFLYTQLLGFVRYDDDDDDEKNGGAKIFLTKRKKLYNILITNANKFTIRTLLTLYLLMLLGNISCYRFRVVRHVKRHLFVDLDSC